MRKVLIIHESLGGGGAERVLVEMLNEFDLSSYQIDLLVVYKSIKEQYLSNIPTKVNLSFIYQSPQRPRLARLLSKIGLAEYIEKARINKIINKKCHYDSIISFMEGSAMKFHSYLLDRSANNISWVHIDLAKNHWSQIYFKSKMEEQRLYNMMSHIVFVSEVAQSSFNKLFAVNPSINQHVIYNIIDSERIKNHATKLDVVTNKFTLVSVGRLAKQKRYDRLIDAAKRLIDLGYDFEFWIIGSGVLDGALKMQVHSLGLQNNIIFKGFVDNPYPYIRAADVFIMTSDFEGYPTVICESLVLGKVIITTEVAGAKELLGDSEYGIISDFSIENLAGHVIEVYKNKDLHQKLSQKSEERSAIFEKESSMSKIYNLLLV